MIKIDKDVPMPDVRGGLGRKIKYPWPDMEVGDSFLVGDAAKSKKGLYHSIIFSPSKRYAPKRFSQRATPEGLRVWRVE